MDVASVEERSPLRLSPVGIAAGLLGLTLVAGSGQRSWVDGPGQGDGPSMGKTP